MYTLRMISCTNKGAEEEHTDPKKCFQQTVEWDSSCRSRIGDTNCRGIITPGVY